MRSCIWKRSERARLVRAENAREILSHNHRELAHLSRSAYVFETRAAIHRVETMRFAAVQLPVLVRSQIERQTYAHTSTSFGRNRKPRRLLLTNRMAYTMTQTIRLGNRPEIRYPAEFVDVFSQFKYVHVILYHTVCSITQDLMHYLPKLML